ncbi:NAD(P)-dependent oxidoreductase [Candidatus Micrarchaeota archaeon]|nr:NAD(P)-dependent oxidoreductase [Candidatus Micrarchaeota archaeon]MBU1930204.1 NAD(P)-dependent oxidoreductase [Candidatus Micrarchaeota archaeon]
MDWKEKTVLITGITGFLGGWLSKALLEKGARIVGTVHSADRTNLCFHKIEKQVELIKTDITIPSEVKKVFELTKPDYCFHLAAVPIPSIAQSDPAHALLVNIGGSLNVLRACANEAVKTFLASTVSVYGNQPIVDENSPVLPNDTYGFSKAKMEEIALFLANTKKFPMVIGRATNLYGPIDSNETVRLVPRNIRAALRKQQIQNTQGLERDFLFIEDAINAYLSLAENIDTVSGRVFNVSYGNSFLGSDIALAIEQLVQNRPVSLQPLSDHCIKHDALFQALQWKPTHSIVQGLEKTIAWYKKLL